jgi:uncharacterized protein (TIGR02145 family)
MKAKLLPEIFVLLGILLPILFSCQKNEDGEMAGLPTVKITSVTDIAVTSVEIGGEIVSVGGAPVIASGLCWSTHENPTVADNKTSDGLNTKGFKYFLFGLNGSTLYYLCAYVTTSAGTGYSNTVSFKTRIDPAAIAPEVQSVTDFDGNSYKTMRIGNQIWMVENLKTTRYRNGDPIANVTDNSAWTKLKSGAYCSNYLSSNSGGHLYNWYVVRDQRNIAPTGWHIPTSEECGSLMANIEKANSQKADINFNFTYAGFRHSESGILVPSIPNPLAWLFDGPATISAGGLWTSTETSENLAKVFTYAEMGLMEVSDSLKRSGFSIRCIKD